MRVLVTATLTADAQAVLTHDIGWTLTPDPTALVSLAVGRPALIDLDRFEAAIVEADPIGIETMQAMPRLRLLVSVRGDPVNIDIAAATARGIPVLYAPGRNAEAVADFTLGLILCSLRHIAHTHHLLKTGELTEDRATEARGRADVIWTWQDASRLRPYALYKGPELRTQVLGLVGFGDVGRRVAERTVSLGVRTLVADPYVDEAGIVGAGCYPVSLEELLREADIVSLHAREGQAPILGQRELHRMKAGAYLINTARASVVDYDALYAALRDGRLAGAALDVFPDEPLPSGSPFLALHNVTLTPHLAGASTNVVEHQSALVVANVRALLRRDRHDRLAIKNPEVLDEWYESAAHA